MINDVRRFSNSRRAETWACWKRSVSVCLSALPLLTPRACLTIDNFIYKSWTADETWLNSKTESCFFFFCQLSFVVSISRLNHFSFSHKQTNCLSSSFHHLSPRCLFTAVIVVTVIFYMFSLLFWRAVDF